jgi:hypothetical protein
MSSKILSFSISKRISRPLPRISALCGRTALVSIPERTG